MSFSFSMFLSGSLVLLGYVFMAVSFGTVMFASAFSVAYRLPIMLRNLRGDGTLSESFLPLWAESGKITVKDSKIRSGAVLFFLFFLVLFWKVGSLCHFDPFFGGLAVDKRGGVFFFSALF
ncbi:hypothetical protein IQC45_20435 [Leptospira interrogans serovar Pomona]|nr:hypothetical protein [Leptospira interrogans serovar Pomona]